MSKKKYGILSSFGFAFRGIGLLFRSERNAKIHLTVLILVLLAGIFLKINIQDWIVVVLCAGAVLATEAINTAIEGTIDLLHPDHSEKAGRIKDISAAAVLFTSITSLICGILIFLPRIIDLCCRA